MPKRFYRILLYLICTVLFAACGGTDAGGNISPGSVSTPFVQATTIAATSSATSSPSTPQTANDPGGTYAYVSKDQLWVARQGGSPVQVTSFDLSQSPVALWMRPVWSPGDAFLAFAMNAYPMGIGGGGCSGEITSLYSTGGLYVMNMHSQQILHIQLPSTITPLQSKTPPANDQWRYMFWEDSNHLLAWYNGADAQSAGLYRYDVNAQTISRILSIKAMGATLQMEKGLLQLISIRYSHEQLFYQVVAHPGTQKGQLAIYQIALNQPGAQPHAIFQEGGDAWCDLSSARGIGYYSPGWDISPDAQQLVVQIINGGSNQATSTIQVTKLGVNAGTTPLFTDVPTHELDQDIRLTWSPDSQTAIADAPYASLAGQVNLYSSSLSQSAAFPYTPSLGGYVSWKPDNSAFVLQVDQNDASKPHDVYAFTPGGRQGRLILHDAHEFSWG